MNYTTATNTIPQMIQLAVQNPGLALFGFGLLCYLTLTTIALVCKNHNEKRWAREAQAIQDQLDELKARTERRRPEGLRPRGKMDWSHDQGLRVVIEDQDGDKFRRDLNEALGRR